MLKGWGVRGGWVRVRVGVGLAEAGQLAERIPGGGHATQGTYLLQIKGEKETK